MMHVDWRWIRQRPQFLAEELAKTFDVRVWFKPMRARRSLPRSWTTLRTRPLLPLPSFPRTNLLRRTVSASQRSWVRSARDRNGPPSVLLTHPRLLEYIPRSFRLRALIYDCMDDYVAMARNAGEERALRLLERELIERADLVLASSNALSSRLAERHGIDRAVLVRNGLDIRSIERMHTEELISTRASPGVVTYVGTVGPWLDFEAILAIANKVPEARIHLVGPITTSIPRHPNLVATGPIPHEDVIAVLRRSSLLLMPFRNENPVATAVDPVKLYEYVLAERPVLAAYYPELDQFDRFVTFYRSTDECVEAARQALRGELGASDENRALFLSEATWESRARVISKALLASGSIRQ